MQEDEDSPASIVKQQLAKRLTKLNRDNPYLMVDDIPGYAEIERAIEVISQHCEA